MKNFSDDVRASVTPMACILSAAVIVLNFCLLDAVRIRALDSLTERRNILSTNALLSYFYDVLEEDYCLYAVYGEKQSEIQNRYAELMREDGRNLFSSLAGANQNYRDLRLMSYEVGGASVHLERPLSDIEVLQSQIEGIMKYKSASNILLKLTEQAEGLIGFSGASEAYAKYVELSEIYDRYKGKLSELHICINGNTEYMLNCVNGFRNVFGVDRIASDQIKKTIPEGLSHTYTEKEANLLKEALRLFAIPANSYAAYNAEAVRIVSELSAIGHDANGKISEIEEWLKRGESGDNAASEEGMYRAVIQDMLAEIKGGISLTRLNEIGSAAEKNRAQLQEAYALFLACEQRLVKDASLPAGTITETVDALLSAYEKYRFLSFSAAASFSPQEDMSGYLLDTPAKDRMTDVIGENDIVIPAEIYTELPSVRNTDGYRYYAAILEDVSSLRSTEELVKMLKGCGSIGTLLQANAKDSLSAYFIDDYIISYFHSDAQKGKRRGRYLNGEVEYIIAGNQSEQENLADVYVKLLELRIGLNTLHILCDGEKMEFARSAGQSLAAMTAGIGASAYTALVVGSWALAESVADVCELEEGRSVPLIKKKGDWYTSVNGKNFGSAYLGNAVPENGVLPETGEITEASDVFSLDYTEYLRLLLLQVPKRVKLYRIQDLIELNLYKKTNNRIKVSALYTAVRCETSAVMDTFILTNSSGKKKYLAEAVHYAEM